MPELTTIDIAALFDDEPAARSAVDRAIMAAVEREGGFVVAGFPGAADLDARTAKLLRFFDLPTEAKRAVATRAVEPDGKRIYRGYVCAFNPDGWAHNEFFDIGPEAPVAGPPIPGMEIFAETNIWPEPEPAPGWRTLMVGHHRALDAVARQIMLSVGRAAGFEEEDFKARFAGGNSTLRLLNYPLPPAGAVSVEKVPEMRLTQEGKVLAAGRHCDASGLSLLWQETPGLEVEAPDGSWRPVPLRANSLSVHLGDVLSVMTESAIPATPHRVVDHGIARRSVGFFLEPALSARLAPIGAAALADARPGAGTYGWHLMSVFSQRPRHKNLVPAPQ